jgi:hypothetical protein
MKEIIANDDKPCLSQAHGDSRVVARWPALSVKSHDVEDDSKCRSHRMTRDHCSARRVVDKNCSMN